MATLRKPLLALYLALAFLVGVTLQLVPVSMDMGIRADMAGGGAAPQTPCTGQMPNCFDHLGCLTIPAIPASSASMPLAFQWISLRYDLAAAWLPGISVKPELSPPI